MLVEESHYSIKNSISSFKIYCVNTCENIMKVFNPDDTVKNVIIYLKLMKEKIY